MKKPLFIICTVAILALPVLGQDKSKATDDAMNGCPMHAQHQTSAQQAHNLNQRGDEGMGFAQDKTTHHFLLNKDGGIIQVTANSAADNASITQIRTHLKHISHAFQSGDFNIPMFVHDQTPPGVTVMQKAREAINYSYEEAENGGRVVISTANPEALKAVHDFLRFQIKEHKTGDALDLQ